MQPFMLTLGNLGAFKTDHIIKILYLDLESKYLQELARTIDYALEPVVTREQRPFVCHVTLARIKGVADKEQFFKEVERYHVERLQFKAMEFILMESELMPDGPIYKEVMRFPFME
jgi:2'-5' RNA ligase